MLLSIFLKCQENTTYCNNKVTVMMGERSLLFLLQDLLLWRKATGTINAILVIIDY